MAKPRNWTPKIREMAWQAEDFGLSKFIVNKILGQATLSDTLNSKPKSLDPKWWLPKIKNTSLGGGGPYEGLEYYGVYIGETTKS